MKNTSLLISLLMILVLTNLTFSSGKKKTTPIPDFPQLIGHWAGTTSQGIPTISLPVITIATWGIESDLRSTTIVTLDHNRIKIFLADFRRKDLELN